jgi:hypothetical protein
MTNLQHCKSGPNQLEISCKTRDLDHEIRWPDRKNRDNYKAHFFNEKLKLVLNFQIHGPGY